MNLQQIQSMSDEELNELSAVNVMGKLYQNGKLWEKVESKVGHRLIKDWNPTNDMNDAYSLLNSLIPTWTVSIGHNLSGWEVALWTGVRDGDNYVSHADKSFPRAITIASILAKEE